MDEEEEEEGEDKFVCLLGDGEHTKEAEEECVTNPFVFFLFLSGVICLLLLLLTAVPHKACSSN